MVLKGQNVCACGGQLTKQSYSLQNLNEINHLNQQLSD